MTKKNLLTMKHVIPFVALIGLLSLSSCKFFEKHKLFSKDVDTLLDVANKPKDTIPLDTVEPVYQEPVIEEPAQKPVVSSSGYGYGSEKYYMIAGSFQNQKFAERYASKMQDMGYQTRIIESPNGFYRVSVKSYNSFSQGIFIFHAILWTLMRKVRVHTTANPVLIIGLTTTTIK